MGTALATDLPLVCREDLRPWAVVFDHTGLKTTGPWGIEYEVVDLDPDRDVVVLLDMAWPLDPRVGLEDVSVRRTGVSWATKSLRLVRPGPRYEVPDAALLPAVAGRLR